ncbi:sodium/glutamate symporter [Caballeronia glathei]|nr:sodium/glutamate symporter [Caballeronia glathei]
MYAFDTTIQVPLILTFFATIGLHADLARLKAGGLPAFACV